MRRKSFWTTKPSEWAMLFSLGALSFSLPAPSSGSGAIFVIAVCSVAALMCMVECRLTVRLFNGLEFKSKYHLEDLIHCGRITRLCAVLVGANAMGVALSSASASMAGLSNEFTTTQVAQVILTLGIAIWMAYTSEKMRTLIDTYPFLKQKGVRNEK